MSDATTFQVASDILALAGKILTRGAWDSWTTYEREQACDWAGAVHLRASDNIVSKKLLIMPMHVLGLDKLP